MLRRSAMWGLLRIATLVLLLGTCYTACGDLLTFELNVPNAALSTSATPPPYGTVQVSVPNGGGAATITVTAEGSYRFGGQGMFGFNVVGSTAGLNVVGIAGLSSLEGVYYSRQVDGFGVFDVVLKNKDGFALSVPMFTFQVTRPGGFASASNLVEFSTGSAGLANAYFVAHVFNATGSITGYAAFVPEAGTVMLLGSGLALLAVGGWMRRRLHRIRGKQDA